MSKKVTSLDLQIAFYNRYSPGFEFMAPNVYLRYDCELDIFGLRKKSGYVDEIEIKMVKSDYLADFNKTIRLRGVDRLKHEALKEGLLHPNRFSFLVPEQLAEKIEVPEYAGLYTYSDKTGRIKHMKRAKLLHKNKLSESLKYKTAKKMAFRYWRQISYE